MNAQRWLALGVVAALAGIIATSGLWLSAFKQDSKHPTATPNTDDFVALAVSEAAQPPAGASNGGQMIPTVDPLVADLMAETGIQTLAVGDDPYIIMAGDFTLIDDLHQARGTASIYKIGDKTHALRLDPFEVTPGPDLHVILSFTAEPRTSSDALLPSHIDLGLLKSVDGAQNYDIPDQINMARYKSVVIYSISLNLVFSTATLTQVRG